MNLPKSPLPLTLLLLLLLLTSPTTATPQETCRTQHPKAFAAIEKFCTLNTNTRIPSTYATNGQSDPANKAHVSIQGACFPAQWVPLFYCKVQFWEMCAGKIRTRRYGRNGCQVWKVKYDGDFVVDWFPGRMKRGVEEGGGGEEEEEEEEEEEGFIGEEEDGKILEQR